MYASEFESEIERLKKVYGSRYYPTERVMIMFQEFKDIPKQRLKEAVDWLILYEKQAPILEDIKKAIDKARIYSYKKQSEDLFKINLEEVGPLGTVFTQQEQEYLFSKCKERREGKITHEEISETLKEYWVLLKTRKKFECYLCLDSGFVWAEKNGYSYVFKCSCNKGISKVERYPVWTKNFETQYQRVQ